jgi:hypothetical protein
VPDLTDLVTEVTPSPQSKVYFSVSPSGSVADVVYLYVLPIFPVLGPDGMVGIFGGLLTAVLAADELDDTDAPAWEML